MSSRGGDYVVEVGSPGGVVATYRYETFEEVLADVDTVAEKHRGRYRALAFGNEDRADVGDCGLTDEELEALHG